MTMVLSNAALLAQLDAFGARANGAKLDIYDGARPANPQTAVTSQTKLLEFTLQNPAFAAASMLDAKTGQILGLLNLLTSQTGMANSTASWGRITASDGTVLWDGTVGTTAGSDFVITTTTITTTTLVAISAIDIRQQTGAP